MPRAAVRLSAAALRRLQARLLGARPTLWASACLSDNLIEVINEVSSPLVNPRPGLLMPPTRPPAMFIADAAGIDFLNSIATPVDTPVEWLATGADLIEWLERAKLVSADALDTVRRSSIPGELDAVAGQARALREWFREFVRQRKGKPLKADALQELAPLNRILERDEEFLQIVKRDRLRDDPGHGALAWRALRRWRSADSLLLPIARAIGDLICNEDFVQVKACEGAACTLLFLDRTHGHARRWCSMAVCGNRAKQAAHRARRDLE